MALSAAELKDYNRQYYLRNREARIVAQREYRKVNSAKVNAANREWRKANLEKCKASQRKWREANPEKNKTVKQAWAQANPHIVNALSRKHQAAKLLRTPPWLNQAHIAEIDGIYHFAKVMEQITGQKYHVDHIEPLQGQDVSGLHVPWNLLAILAQDNGRKGNRRIETNG